MVTLDLFQVHNVPPVQEMAAVELGPEGGEDVVYMREEPNGAGVEPSGASVEPNGAGLEPNGAGVEPNGAPLQGGAWALPLGGPQEVAQSQGGPRVGIPEGHLQPLAVGGEDGPGPPSGTGQDGAGQGGGEGGAEGGAVGGAVGGQRGDQEQEQRPRRNRYFEPFTRPDNIIDTKGKSQQNISSCL